MYFWTLLRTIFLRFFGKGVSQTSTVFREGFVACFVKGCLRQTPSKVKALVRAARGKCRFLRLLKTTKCLGA
jgi:hypothetical protein